MYRAVGRSPDHKISIFSKKKKKGKLRWNYISGCRSFHKQKPKREFGPRLHVTVCHTSTNIEKKNPRIFFLDVKLSRGLTLRMQTPRMCYFNLCPISYSDPERNHDSEIWEKKAPPWCSFFKQVTGNWPFSNIIYSSCSSQPGPTDGWRVALELRHHWFFYIYNPRTADSR